MKHIVKGEEPQDLKDWKSSANENWQPTWDGLPGPVKRNLHSALMTEQGFICCYCGKRVSDADSHIEHFKPQVPFEADALVYANLLCSCQRQTERREPLHCGKLKDNWYDEHLLAVLSERDEAGQYAECCFAVVHVLNALIPVTQQPG